MSNIILIKRGESGNLPILLEGELGFCVDTHIVYIGSDAGNIPVGTADPETIATLQNYLSEHEKTKINNENGVHGIRYWNEKLWMEVNGEWVELVSGIDIEPPIEPPIVSGSGEYMTIIISSSPFITIFKNINQEWKKLNNPVDLPLDIPNGVTWSPDGKYLAVCWQTTAPYVRIWKNINDTFIKMADPTPQIAGHGRVIKFSPNGKYLGCGFDNSPFFRIWVHDRTNEIFQALPNPAILPPSKNSNVYGLDFSPDEENVTCAWLSQPPYFGIWKILENSLVKLNTDHIGNLPSHAGDVHYSKNGVDLVISHQGTPGFAHFKRDEIDRDYYYKTQGPNSWPAGNGRGIRISDDGKQVIGAWDTEPFVGIFHRTNDAWTMKKRQIEMGGGSYVNRLGFSPDGTYLACPTDWAQYRMVIFKKNIDGEYFPLESPYGLPDLPLTGVGRCAKFNPKGDLLVIGHDGAPYMQIYKREGDNFIRLPNPELMPANPMYQIEWTEDGKYFAIAGQGTLAASNPRLSTYKVTEDEEAEGGYIIERTPLPNAVLPQNSNCIAWSPFLPDLGYRMLCVGWSTSANFIRLYRFEDEQLIHQDGFNAWPPAGGDLYSCRFSPDGTHLVASHGYSATTNHYYMSLWVREGITWRKTTWSQTFLLNYKSHTGTASDLTYTPDGKFLIVAGINTPTVFRREGNVYHRVGIPSMLATGGSLGATMTADGKFYAIGHYTTPFVSIWERTYDSFEMIGTPGLPPEGGVSGTRHSSEIMANDASEFAIANIYSPFLSMYKKGTDAFLRAETPKQPPVGASYGMSMTYDGTYCAVTSSTSPTVIFYKTINGIRERMPAIGSVITTAHAWSVAFSSTGEYAAVGLNVAPWIVVFKKKIIDGIETYEQLPDIFSRQAAVVREVAWSPNDKYLAVTTHTTNVTVVYRRDGDTFERLAPFVFPPNGAGYSCAWAPNGKYLAIGTDTSPYLTVYSVDSETDTFIRLDDPDILCPSYGKGISFSSDSQKIAVSVHTSPFVVMYMFDNGRLRRISDVDIALPGVGNGISFSSIKDIIAVGHNVSPWLTMYEPGYHSFRKLPDPDMPPAGATLRGNFSSDGKFYAVGSSIAPFLIIYRINGEEITKSIDPDIMPSAAVNDVAFSPNGKYLAIAANSAPYFYIYKKEGNNFIKLNNPISLPAAASYGLAWAPDSHHICFTFNAITANRPVRIFKIENDILTDIEQPTLDIQPAGACYRCAYSPDGRYLYLGCSAGIFYDMYIRDGNIYKRYRGLNVNPAGVSYSGSFSSDGKFFAYSHNATPWIRVFKYNPGINQYDWHYNFSAAGEQPQGIPAANNGMHVAFSPDNRFLAFAGNDPYIRIWERKNDRWLQMPMPLGVPNYCNGIGFSPDNKILAVCCASAPFILFYKIENLAYKRMMSPWTRPVGQLQNVVFSGDGEKLGYVETSAMSNFIGFYDYVKNEGYERMENPQDDIQGAGQAIATIQEIEKDL